MNLQVDVERVCLAQKAVRAELLAERTADGHWVGQPASSPFATAAAISALVLAHRRDTDDVLRDELDAGSADVTQQIVQGDLCELLLESVHWLARHQNPDGGWGDCVRADSNLAATMLVQAALRLTGIPAKYADLMARADDYFETNGGASGLWRQFENRKTLVAPVLANAALADMVAWRQVPTLAFETACLPKQFQQRFPVPASSQELPAYIAVGRAKFHHDPPRNPLPRLLRRGLSASSLAVLEQLQAADGGFVDSTPITAFVVMNLSSIGYQDHPVVQRAMEFLLTTIQSDASWRVENNLSVWNTTLAVNHLMSGGVPTIATRSHTEAKLALSDSSAGSTIATPATTAWDDTAAIGHSSADTSLVEGATTAHAEIVREELGEDELVLDERCLNWLLDCQHTPANSAGELSSGGWSRGNSAGALPNVLDTASALSALLCWRRRFAELQCERIDRAAMLGMRWMLESQHDDGGWPTFSRAAQIVATDESGIDATALALRALAAWHFQSQLQTSGSSPKSPVVSGLPIGTAIDRGFRYLETQQRDDGRLVPLWFGNEHQLHDENPVYGTAQVLMACADSQRLDGKLADRAAQWLVSAQHSSGGWGPPRAPRDYSGVYNDGFRAWRANDTFAKFCSVEETALAVSALLPLADTSQVYGRAVANGLAWLASAVEQDAHRQGAVVGFSFTKLWYHERLYPLVFAAGALTKAAPQLSARRQAVAHVS